MVDVQGAAALYGEPRKIREVAARLDARAEALRTQARELHARSHDIEWRSVAADRMRESAGDRRDELVAVARDYEEAARRVREHADKVQELIDLIASIERQATTLINAALDRAKAAYDSVVNGIKDALTPGDEADYKLAATQTPPSGHKDWLDIPEVVPGIRL